jgi:hypothetical protein
MFTGIIQAVGAIHQVIPLDEWLGYVHAFQFSHSLQKLVLTIALH